MGDQDTKDARNAFTVDPNSKKDVFLEKSRSPKSKNASEEKTTPLSRPQFICCCELLLSNDRSLSLNESSKCIVVKRLMMFLPITALLCFWYIPQEIYFSLYFLSPVCFISSYAILCNFPQLGSWIHTKPLHVNDLRVLKSKKQAFLWWYTYITNALLAVVITGIIDWTFTIQKKHHKASTIEILGTLGGVLSLYLKFESVVALSILHLTFRLKQQRSQKSLKHTSSITKQDLLKKCSRNSEQEE